MEHSTVDRSTPTKDEIKLIIENSLLELEKRMTKSINEALLEQNRTYMTEIVAITEKVAKHDVKLQIHTDKINGFKTLVATVSTATGVLGGFVGFLIAQLTGAK